MKFPNLPLRRPDLDFNNRSIRHFEKKKNLINQFFTAFKEPEPKYGSREWKVHFFVSKLMLQIWKNYSNLFGTNIRMVKNPIISVY